MCSARLTLDLPCLAPLHLQVKGLQFNPFSPNLLASGAADGELCIWDISTPGSPSLYPSLKGAPSPGGAGGEITSLAWNCKVQHILASTTSGGATVVWDLKRQKPVISFTDAAGSRRCSAIAWHPEVATQLVTASDDDRCPVLQVWDLRNSISPAAELSGHSKGVLALSWCPNDSQLVLTCAKDNRTLLWDMAAGVPCGELPSSGHWNFDAQWCARQPGLVAASNFDAKVHLFNALDAVPVALDAAGTGGSGWAKAPGWLRRPAGVSFGFGGRLATFGGANREVTLTTVATDTPGDAPDSASAADEAAADASFQQALASAPSDRDSLKSFCAARATEAAAVSEAEAETWEFLRILLDGDSARHLLLSHLGYQEAPPTPGAAEVGTTDAGEDARIDDDAAGAAPNSNGGVVEEDDHDFFDKLATDTPRSSGASPRAAAAAADFAAPAETRAAGEPEALSPRGPEAERDADDVAIQHALVMGNYHAAVAACLAAQRLGDALVLAAVGGTDLWLSTQAEYLRRTPRPYLRVVSAVVKNDLAHLVASRPVFAWRETLALLCTYAPSGEWGALTGALAQRLAAAGQHHPAVLCRICAGDMDGAVQHWSTAMPRAQGAGKASAPATPVPLGHLRRVVEKGVVLMHACSPAPQHQACGSLCGVVNTYAELLAAQGKLEAALQYLSMVPADDSPESAVLRDRILHSRAATTSRSAAPQQAPQQQYGGAGHMYAPQAVAPVAAQRPVAAAPQYAAPPAARPAAVFTPPPAPAAASPSFHYAPVPPAPPTAPASYAPSPSQPVAYTPQPAPSAPHPPAQQRSAYAPVPPRHTYAPAPPVTPPPQAVQQVQYAPQAPPPPPPPSQAASFAPVPGMSMASQQPHAGFVPTAPPAGPPAPVMQQQQQQQHQGVQPPRYAPQAQQMPRGAYPGAPAAAPAPEAAPPAPAPPPAPAGPPANTTLETVSTSEVGPDARGVVTSLMALYTACTAAAAGNPGKKRELDDSSKRLGALLWRLNKREVSASVLSKLQALCGALDRGDLAAVNALVVQLTSADWDECGQWLPALKRLIKARSA